MTGVRNLPPTSCEARLSEVVRASHGRILATLCARTRDISGAEDALATAYRSALETWAEQGVPDKPEAWLLTAARNQLTDRARSAYTRTSTSLHHSNGEVMELAMPHSNDDDEVPDERLKLMFAAAHPALDASVRAPLVMQTVLGMEASEIARIFVVPVATMAQRLVRAKTKIRDAGIPFVVPGQDVWPERLEYVLEAIYGAYSAGLEQPTDPTDERGGEALYLADMLATLLPEEPEALGLASLICFSASRAGARYNESGELVPLNQQDVTRWDRTLIAQASRQLASASTHGTTGRFQLEAAVHAVHADRRRTGRTDWRAILQLYEGLLSMAPTYGLIVARAYAISQYVSLSAGLAALSPLSDEEIEGFAPALLLRAHLHEQHEARRAAASDYERAALLLPEGQEKQHAQRKAERIRATLV